MNAQTATSKSTGSEQTAGVQRLPRWANTVLVILIGHALAALFIKIIPDSDAAITMPTASTVSAAPGPEPSLDKLALGRQIAGRHLFGDATEAPKEPEKKVKAPVVETKLNLKLAGVFAYTPQRRAMAIITSNGNDENAYRVGDTIIGNASLKEVFADYVIIDNRGREEILKLPENSTPIATRQPVVTQAASSQSGGSGDVNGGIPELPSTPGALRDTLARNPSLLGRVVAAEPYQENGKLVGYRITPKQNPEILEAQGIIAGDVIKRVNNIELNSQKQGIRALRNAVKAQNLEVTILRDGIEIPLSISLAE